MKNGIQISSFRPVLTTPEELKTACEKMAGMGCTIVQTQWIDPSIPPETVAQALKGAGISSVSVQDFYTEVAKHPDYYTRINALTEGKWVCVSRIPEAWKNRSQLHTYANELRRMNQTLASLGQELCFHPVSADFRGEPGFDPVAELLAQYPELMICADLYHLHKSDRNICAWLKKYAGRVCMVHFKDSVFHPDGTEELVPPGQGQVDWAGVAETCREIGVEYAFAEQERWQGDPFDRLREGFDWLGSQNPLPSA